MSISQAIRAGMEGRLPFHHRLEQFVASDAGLTVRCELAGAERLGCAVTQVEVVSEGLPKLPAAALASRANRFCESARYLAEPLKLVELDRLAGTTLVRSAVPKKRGTVLSYFEFTEDAARHATLRRFAYDAASKTRSATEFVLTPDQLEQLLDDLVALQVDPDE